MRSFLLSIIFLSNFIFAQTEAESEITVGNGFGIVNQPISLSSEFSHSQTIYYSNDLDFQGNIEQLSFQLEISSVSLENSKDWIIKIGYTDIDEFSSQTFMVNPENFTEVFNGEIEKVGNQVFVTFNEPFYYNGSDNIILDIEEITPGSSSSIAAFKGKENFNNPPNRSSMIFTSNGQSQTLTENSYAKTTFYGDFEVCASVAIPSIENITTSSADIILNEDPNIPNYRYNYNIEGEEIPIDYQTTSNLTINLENLLPATTYNFNIKADCNLYESDYYTISFSTRIEEITLGSIITFDEEENPGTYFLDKPYQSIGQTDITNSIGVNNTNALRFSGATWDEYWDSNYSWNDYNIWQSNSKFRSQAHFKININENSTNPILKFDLFQKSSSYFRILIDEEPYDFEYNNTTDYEEYKKVSLDLSAFIGKTIDVEMQHMSLYTDVAELNRSTFIDNIEITEADCLPEEIEINNLTTNSFNLSLSENSNNDVIIIEHDENPFTSTIEAINNSYTAENLNTATPYDIYYRNSCSSNDFSYWKKTFVSTLPEIITIPYDNYFGDFDNSYALNYHENSFSYFIWNGNLYLAQTNKYDNWTNISNSTEENFWLDNKGLVSSLTFRVDASSLSSLAMELSFKQGYHHISPETSSFRILINGNQIGDTYHPTTRYQDPFQQISIDLTEYVGDIVEVKLQHCGRSNVEYNDGLSSPKDVTAIKKISFDGEEGLSTEKIKQKNNFKIYPNPTYNSLTIENNSGIKNFKIIDLNGRTIKSQEKPYSTISKTRINVSDLNSSVYFIKITDKKGGTSTKKFIKK